MVVIVIELHFSFVRFILVITIMLLDQGSVSVLLAIDSECKLLNRQTPLVNSKKTLCGL